MMTNRKIFMTILLSIVGVLGVWAQTDDQYNTAVTNIGNGTYRIYALSGETKYYLKVALSGSGNDRNFCVTTSTADDASQFEIAQNTDGSSKLKETAWKIANGDWGFTNPDGGSNTGSEFTAGTCLRGHLLSNRSSEYDRQVLYYDGTAYAVRSTNSSGTSYGGGTYWNLDESNNACYAADASFIWYFEAVSSGSSDTSLENGLYRMYAPNSNVNLYANGNYLQKDQATEGDNTDVFNVTSNSGAYTFATLDGKYLGDFAESTFGGQKKTWVTVGTTAQQWQVTKNANSANYSTAWVIGKPGIELTADGWMNYNSKGAVLSWKVVDGSNEDANSYFELKPVDEYTVTVSGATGVAITVSAKGYVSNVTAGGKAYVDATAAEADITVSVTGYTISSQTINTSAKTITVTLASSDVLTKSTTEGDTVDGTEEYSEIYTVTGSTYKVQVAVTKTQESGESAAATHGMIAAAGSISGSDVVVTLTATPVEGYKLGRVIVEKAVLPGDADSPSYPVRRRALDVGSFVNATVDANTATFTMPAASSVKVTALFAKETPAPTVGYDKPTRTVTITNTAGSAGTLYYKVNNGELQNTTDMQVVLSDITVNTGIVAYIIDTRNESSTEVNETFNVAATPAIQYTDGVNKVGLQLTAASETNTADSKLYYTTDGSAPTTESTELTENTELDITADMTVKVLALDADGNYSAIAEQAVVYARYLTVSTEWTTFCSPMTLDVPDGLEAYVMTAVEHKDTESGTATLEKETAIFAGTPMVIKRTGTDVKYRVYPNTTAAKTKTSCSEFKGAADADIEFTNDGKLRYVLKDGMFIRSLPGTLKKYNCYLEFTPSSPSAAPHYSITIGGSTTRIQALGTTVLEDGAWYNLNGVRISQPTTKGVYIRNGKKVVVK